MENENQGFKRSENAKNKQSKLKIISVIVIILLLLCIIGAIVYFVLSNNAKVQLDDFEEAVQSKDYKAVSKTFVFDTKPLNLKLRGSSWIFKSINLCYNQCITNIKKYGFLYDERRIYLHWELDFINKYP